MYYPPIVKLGLSWNYEENNIPLTQPPVIRIQYRKVWGFESPPAHTEYVFTYRNKPLKDIRTAFKNACNRAGIKSLRFHDLRHIFATRLVLAGVDLATVSKLLGHSSIQMTTSHSTPEALKSAVSKLNKV